MTDLWWQRGNVCHDVTNCHADVSQVTSVASMCSDCVGDTTKTDPISPDNYSQIAQIAHIFLAFSIHLWNKTFGLPYYKTSADGCFDLWKSSVGLLRITFGSQLGMKFLLLLSDLIINQLFDRGWIFITDGFICPHLKCTFQPGVGWKVSDLTWLACLDLKPKLKLSFQYFDISTILQTGDRGL